MHSLNYRPDLITRSVSLLLIAIVWLVPFAVSGVAKKRFFKPAVPMIVNQHTLSSLFTNRNQSWGQLLFEVQTNGQSKWITLSTEELSPTGVLGYRQRLDRVVTLTNNKGKAQDETRERLASWIAQRQRNLHPENGAVSAVQICQTVWTTNMPELIHPAGHWEVNPAKLPSNVHKHVLAQFVIKDGKAMSVTKRDASKQKEKSKAKHVNE